jgi:C-terminal processing protease CtpA/Prc
MVPHIGQTMFTFEDEESRQFTANLEPVAPNTKLDWINVTKDLPLCLQRPNESFWFVTLPEAQTLYVNFRTYVNLEQHAHKLWEFIDLHMPKCLIIDMRQNGGGNHTLARSQIIYEVQKRPALNSTGCLFVIIGRGTFSAAMTNATDFRRETDAILVGEPTGARPKGYQENHWLTLPHSGLHVSIASRYYKFQDIDTPAVIPDPIVEIDWTDYEAGRDSVIEWILSN